MQRVSLADPVLSWAQPHPSRSSAEPSRRGSTMQPSLLPGLLAWHAWVSQQHTADRGLPCANQAICGGCHPPRPPCVPTRTPVASTPPSRPQTTLREARATGALVVPFVAAACTLRPGTRRQKGKRLRVCHISPVLLQHPRAGALCSSMHMTQCRGMWDIPWPAVCERPTLGGCHPPRPPCVCPHKSCPLRPGTKRLT